MLEVSWFVCGVLYFILYCYLFNKLVCNTKFKLNRNIIVLSFLIGIVYFFISKFNIIYLRPYIIHIYIFISLKFIYRRTFSKTLIGILIVLIISFIAEAIFGFTTIALFNINIQNVSNSSLGYLYSNVAIFIISILLSKIKIIKNVFLHIINWYSENELRNLYVFVIMSIIIITFLLYNNFMELLPNSILLITNLFCVCVIIFVIGFFKEKSNNNRIITEYDQLLDYVKTYEKVIETKSKNQHEYKNQLILIRGMVKNKEAVSYIDNILENEKDDRNIELLKKLQYLPQGGLKGLIYYKVEKMIDKKIDVYIDISAKLKNTKVLKENLQDLSKIIGVYLDNAIEAVQTAEKKYIVIEAYVEDGNIVFSFSNTYKGDIALNKVDKEGYTTKGEGKGYGLSLVKDIIDKNKKFSQERELNGIYYVQKLYIKK